MDTSTILPLLELPDKHTGSTESLCNGQCCIESVIGPSRRNSCLPSSCKGVAFSNSSAVKQHWCDVLHEFTQYTTLHGLRYITHRDSMFVRRLLWLMVTLTCSALLVFQIVDRVQYYYESPVTVNFRVNYNQSLMFPALTICNQNAFRATAAHRSGLYELIKYMYQGGAVGGAGGGTGGGDLDWISGFNASQLSLESLFLDIGHRKEDFIIKCMWDGTPCGADDFTPTFTDYGKCFTFNQRTGEKARDILHVNYSGSEHGLKLTLNVEQYEAMPGPREATGIKILATDQSMYPRVDEIGIAIPTGSYAFVGLGVVVINNLPRPYGDCGEVALHSSRKYSSDLCKLECVTDHVIKRCGCRHFYMPNISGMTPVCTLYQYYRCYKAVEQRLVDMCDCPTSCNYLLFDPAVSYASSSTYSKGNLLEAAMSHTLRNRFIEARETTERMDAVKYQHFNSIVKDSAATFDKLKTVLTVNVQDKLESQFHNVFNISKRINEIIKTKEFLNKYQEYTIQKNFMRARDAMEERTLSMVCLGFHEHVFNMEFKLKSMAEAQRNNDSILSRTLHTLLTNCLQSGIETDKRALANYTQLYNAYENGERIFDYRYYDIPSKDNAAIVPRPLLKESLIHNYYARMFAPRVGEDIVTVMNHTKEFQTLVNDVYLNETSALDYPRMHKASGAYLKACEDYFHSKSAFYFESIDRPVRIIQKRMQDFELMKLNYETNVHSLLSTLHNLNTSLKSIRENLLGTLAISIKKAQLYFEEWNVTKSDLIKDFTSKNVSEHLHSMEIFFTELRQRGQFVYEMWFEIKTDCLEIWDAIINDNDSVEYYRYKNMDAFLHSFAEVEVNLTEAFSNIRDANDFRFVIHNTDNQFFKAIATLRDDLEMFRKGNNVDEQFVRDNFLQLDVYYKELRHEQIEQQEAYSIIALLCDIGGSMGLFIGASAMTMFEVIDIVLSQTVVTAQHKLRNRYQKPYK